MSQITDAEIQERIAALKNGVKLTPEEIAEHTKEMVGYNYTVDDYYEVGREEVRKHARAVQDDHPVHWDEEAAKAMGHPGLIAAPTFVSVLGIIAQRRLFEDIVTGYDLWQIMQTDQRLVFHKPITVGDRLICDVSLDSFRQMAGTDVMVTKNVIWNQHDEPVMTTWTSLVARPAVEVDPEVVDELEHVMMNVDREPVLPKTVHGPFDRYHQPDPVVEPKAYSAISFDDLEVGQELPPLTKTLTRGNLVNYAGVAGDPNPIHFSDEVAKVIGMETVVAHGMQTMGLGASFITRFVGDPAAIFEYNVRFTSPVYVYPDTYANVDFTGKIKSLDPETRRGVIAIVAKQGDRKIFGRALAHVQFN
ncbi:fused (3R)-hydroxyacyl-ACP dehydratase subunits HadA/HadB [Gordonia sp. NB41Y]|uniref:fused (3R)-hydroxyacyl-ACP dehydratase subunits HadA/HadB n=1 Tax=Gordonia sp. NB41Y TaxID=875808 RepID=UPI0006B16A4D|nr:fused (3R)-hydroxyacyl-ACP dehydratase subunits HadA/HadB [Gordonia sp. NB41Y]EMP11644.2 dehydratase [Gordonia sp. NB41Y]WLP92086.1 fused (3R)-hydroxyacyl-ACP dehydratase subunits HadA/HadB [Gordonia sp. NB41Y]